MRSIAQNVKKKSVNQSGCLRPDTYTYASAMRACEHIGNVQRARVVSSDVFHPALFETLPPQHRHTSAKCARAECSQTMPCALDSAVNSLQGFKRKTQAWLHSPGLEKHWRYSALLGVCAAAGDVPGRSGQKIPMTRMQCSMLQCVAACSFT